MLRALTIENFVIIDHLALHFEDGLTILTGETGAGKSILLDALGLVLGARLEGKPVGPQADRAIIVAEFELPGSHAVFKLLKKYDLIISETLILKRVITNQGRNRISVNGMPVSLQILKEIGACLIEIHGQHESHHLLDSKTHLTLLDQYGKYPQLLQETERLAKDIKRLEKEKSVLLEEISKTEKEANFIAFTLEEIDTLNYQPGEEKTLEEQCFKLKHAENLKHTLVEVEKHLTQPVSVADQIFKAEKNLQFISEKIDTKHISHLMQCFIDANHAITEAEKLLQQLQNTLLDDALLPIETLEERLLDLKDFAKKHRIEIASIPDYQANLTEQLAQLDLSKTHFDALEVQLSLQYKAYQKATEVLHDARVAAAEKLEHAIMKEFPPLKLEKAKFLTQIQKQEREIPHPQGSDHVEFMIQTNPGSAMGPLSKIASGGEFSRIILAIKVILSQNSITPVFIFDEVDTGIGGAVADAVGTRLEKLAQKFQLFVITHSPQIAAKADHHYHVSKVQEQNQTRTIVTNLDSKTMRLEEIARMLSGDRVTDQARMAANSLVGNKSKTA